MSSFSEKSLPGALGAELAKIAANGRPRAYRAGEVVFPAGAPGDGFYIVQTGRVQLTAVVGDTEPRVLATVGPDDFFGEMAVLDEAPRSATATAEVDTVALFLDREALKQLLDTRPGLTLDLVREFSRRMRTLNQKYLDEIIQAERLGVVGRFAGTIVHDFKNPLTVISLAAELGCGENTSLPLRTKAEQTISRQIDRITAMLQELIDFARPSGQKISLHPTAFAAFMAPLAEELGAECAARRVQLVLPEPPPAVEVRIEAQRLSRVFYNLVHNAVDAMRDLPGPGTITLRFVPADGALRIEVEDTGKGIAPEIAQKLFEPFATHGKQHGTGLGLSICRKIAEDHGGRIWAHSEPGRGALFCFTLPLGA